MSQKLVLGPINRGIRTDRTAFVIDNDSFPSLLNAYQWRGRVKRKRGTSLLGRLTRYLQSGTTLSTQANGASYSNNDILNDSSFDIRSSQPEAQIVPESITITVGALVFTDDGLGNLSASGNNTGTINYSSGALSLSFSPALGAPTNVVVQLNYYPVLPVMGLEVFNNPLASFPNTVAFDSIYAYNITTTVPFSIYDVSYYKNPTTSSSLPNYVRKTTWTPLTWSVATPDESYQQYWTTNYQNAMWTTYGIEDPFVSSATHIGMQYKAITDVSITSASGPAVAEIEITGHGLVIGDFLFINEVGGVTGINFQTGYVTDVIDVDNVEVTFPNATLGGAYTSGGIAQYLTNTADEDISSLRWYDGDPTSGPTHTPSSVFGWVNFSPPLSQESYSISDLPAAQYYLVGARIILQFKDRLLFFGPVVQTSSSGSQVYLQDTIIYSQNGTPYYTASFTGDEITAQFNPVLLPSNQTSAPNAFFSDVTGFGGFIQVGLDEPIVTVSSNEDVLILGFTNYQARLVYTGNDIVPFNLYVINSELGSSGTFSAVNLDQGVISVGPKGIVQTSQTSAQRIDLDIPDTIFQFNLLNSGSFRICAQRDFINEWIYYTFLSNNVNGEYIFPNATLQYNYRDKSWGLFYESYTTYGTFRQSTGYTWDTIGEKFPTWESWTDNWEAGSSTLLQPQVIGGNQQGFVIFRDDGLDEAQSLTIQSISGSVITSPNHCLNLGDYIVISDCIGTIANNINQRIYRVNVTTQDTFTVLPSLPSGTYLGGGLIKRFYKPFIQSKQFPVSWEFGRKTRIGSQQYLLTETPLGQVTLAIYLSQDGSNAFNLGPIQPNPTLNSSLVYTSVLYTCLESTNLGLTPANTNLLMIGMISPDGTIATTGQQQIWHRLNTSLIGDTVQFAITLSDDQMEALTTVISYSITGATNASSCVLTCNNNASVGQLVKIENVGGMIELNGNVYLITAVSSTTITLSVDSTAFGTYTSGGSANIVSPVYQTAEIELHAAVINLSPSQMLA